ncbi:hypothetical protein O9993_05205 [Vibrio lentus]|nr:hypothetical protein [Vibrio lentus]
MGSQNQEAMRYTSSAWETDFASDPHSFFGEMNQKIELLVDGDEGKSEAWEIQSAMITPFKKGIPALIKVGIAGKVIDAEKMIEAESSKLMEGFSKDLLGM